MQTVRMAGTGILTSPLGMGCASLGSRISRKQGLRALDEAFAGGVTWYDVAPAYGAGEAEAILGQFLTGKRDRVLVCSKVGLAPPRKNGLIKLAYSAGRPLLRVAQGLRSTFRKMPSTRNVRVPLTPSLIEGSIERSLKRLGTDHLDVFALHDPIASDLERDDILETLYSIRQRGLIRFLSVAGGMDAALIAADNPAFDIIQIADDPQAAPLAQLRQKLTRPVGFVTHSVLGIGSARDKLLEHVKNDTPHSEESASSQLMRRAFLSNPDGVVLASMFSADHLASNLTIARSVAAR